MTGASIHSGLAYFQERERLEATAWFLGERIDVRSFERGDALAVAPVVLRAGEHGLAVVFRYGVVVLYELSETEAAAFLASLAPLVTGAFAEAESEGAEMLIDPSHEERIDADGRLRLRAVSVERLQIVAEVLAKSAVLAHYESSVSQVLDRIEPLAQRLRGRGRSGINSRAVLREIGEGLLTETRTIGRVEVTEKPEQTWDRPDLDRLYVRLRDEYELRERDRILARKLELISRAAGISLELVQNRRSLRVEWYIVALIAVEILIILYDMFARA